VTALDPDSLLVVSGPPRVEDVTEDRDGSIESITTSPLRVFEKRPDGSLLELHGDHKCRALEAFWASVDPTGEPQEGPC
jgi:hypothetical protein